MAKHFLQHYHACIVHVNLHTSTTSKEQYVGVYVVFSHVTKMPGDLGPRSWAGLLQIYYSSILGADSTPAY